MTFLRSGIQEEAIDVAETLRPLRDAGTGAVASFEGVTRADGEVVALEYETHLALAEKQLQELVETAIEKWSLRGALAIHRTGIVPVGETGVLVAVSAGHRSEAFEACEWLIDTLKATVAIWKCEISADGSRRWL